LEVDGLPVHKLLERLNWSAENEYVKLTELSWRIHSLSNRDTMLALLTPSDSRVEVRLERAQYNGLTRPKGSFALPNPNNKIDLSRIGSVTEKVSDSVLSVVDGMPYFRIDGPFLYREAFEIYLKRTTSVLSRFGVTMKPEEFLSHLEAFRDKSEEVLEVVKSQRKILIDLRGATGGNSIITPLIVYGLFGYKETITPKEYTVTKLSKLLGANEKSKEGHGYDFSDEDLYYRVKKEGLTRELEEQYLKSSNGPNAYPWNFNREWQGIRDLKVCVSVSARTFSAGFNIALSLWKQGAKIVGTTPSQVANCFIDVIPFKLKNSGIEGQVATKLYIGLPERYPDMNILLRPHIELNYEYYRGSGFDPNATIALCIKELK